MENASADTIGIQRIHEAASKHEDEKLQSLIDELTFVDCSAVDVLDPHNGRSPLHAAIASCFQANGSSNGESEPDMESAAGDTLRLLLENGAIWNQLDKNDETPGCLARRLGLLQLYQLMVDAGVRAEILLNRLDGYEQLEDDEEEDDQNLQETLDEIVPELVDATKIAEEASSIDVNSKNYLSSTLSISNNRLLDDQQNGVMMEWERGIMKRSADVIVDNPDLKVLNIGAGMLIFDTIVQQSANKPLEHHIVEAHPDILADMKEKGWYEKPGVFIHEGKWQDVLPSLVADNKTFDAIYFDTFAESYADFTEFFSEQVIGLLDQEGKWSFFNGMGADRQISYDVYQQVVEMDLMEAGFEVEWENIDIPNLDDEWKGVKRSYWNIDNYRLPVCRFMS